MKNIKLLFLCLVYPVCVLAVQIHPNAGTTSASFLKLGVGSRAVGMGGTFAAISDDMTALYWNPAGLTQVKTQEFSLTHNESFEGIRHDFAGVAMPLSRGTIAAAIYGLYTPNDIERRSGLNENDPYEPLSAVESLFRSYDIALHAAYARQVNKSLSIGAGVKFIQQTIDNISAYGAAVDAGALYHVNKNPLSLGFAVQNIGTPIQFRDKAYGLPSNFKLGAAYRWSGKLITAIDLNQPVDNFMFVSFGSEYAPMNIFTLRAGYRYRLYGLELGDLSGMSCGIGFNYPVYNVKLKLDYAFLPFGALGNSHRISIGMAFGPETATRVAPRKKTANTAPVLPQEPQHAQFADKYAGFQFNSLKVAVKPKIISRAFSSSSVKGESSAGDFVSVKGTINAIAKYLSIESGEKRGNASVYKHFVFKKNSSFPILNTECVVRVPKELANVSIDGENEKGIIPKKISEDEQYIYYSFHMNPLAAFDIINHE